MGNEPQGEQQYHGPAPRAGMNGKHKTCHNAENARYQRKCGAKAQMPVHTAVEHNVSNARGQSSQTIQKYKAHKDIHWLKETVNSQADQKDADGQFQPSEYRTILHFASCVFLSSMFINSSPVMVSFSYRKEAN